ncbi:unnamed protein product [Brassicogethes aeneus]|uniref:[histone H4]-lysine(20) N-methyltransferase n=1 Tax=Brassicogethes aeneus TaxID=1431903 RepID=A0A9P0AWG3_BRAAE|nr:unnamed protein product [Brassicogethes aeneus]
MVRGRRVRAVVACSRNDDCCSPNPKRKDQKINITGKLSHTPTKTHTITEFFQAVCDIDIKNTENNEIKELRRARRKGTPTKLDLNKVEPTEVLYKSFNNELILNTCPTTPVMNKLRNGKDVSSPPTPHRIELRSEVVEEIKEEILAEPLEAPIKVEKKLNVKQEADKQQEKKIKSNDITSYFSVRRSVRKTKKVVLEEKQRILEEAVRGGKQDGLKVCDFEGKGRGVIATKDFEKGDYVIEYAGELIDTLEAKKREEQYAQDQTTGCYMYYFKHNEQQYCIDATAESGKLGRLVNHSRFGNLATRTIMLGSKPRLVLIAKDDIKEGQEVLYDYGDRSKESLKHHPWLAN